MKYLYLVLLVLFMLVSCDYNYYPKVSESLSIVNNTDTTFIVEYGFDRFPMDYYDEVMDTVPSKMKSYRYLCNKTADLWIREAAFENLVTQIKIYRIENNDTVFVDKSHYNKRTQWESEFFSKYFDSNAMNINTIYITPEMFNK